MADTRTQAESQYGSSTANLDTRLDLHRRFSLATRSWPEWVFDRLPPLAGRTVVEVGAGTGVLWSANARRLPGQARLLLTDMSAAMCRALFATVAATPGLAASVARAESERIPAASGSADVVIANHMLYHVPEPERAIAEMARVLRPGGHAIMTTNGTGHLRQIFALLAEAGVGTEPPMHGHFPLEAAADLVSRFFAEVDLARYEDALEVTEADALVRYAASIAPMDARQLDRLHATVSAVIAARGAFHVDKVTGLLTARR